MKLPLRFALAVGVAILECAAQTPTARPGRLVNLSIRTAAGRDADTLIVGFAIGGTTGAKPVLVRGIGPALAQFGVAGTLDDPVIAMFQGDTRIADNDDWGGNAAIVSAATATGAFPLSATSRDAALATALAPGAYSVQLTGKGSATGTALAEIYDASGTAGDAATALRLVNVSARTRVNAGSDPLTTGFVIGGDTACTVLVRAIGPTLASFGVTGVLADPKLELFSGTTKLYENDNWSGTATLSRAFASVGAFTLDAGSKDAALLVTLPPGSYTALVSGVGGTSGVALVEVYAVQQSDPFELLDSFLAMDSTLAGPSPDVTIGVGRSDLIVMRNGAIALWQKPVGGTAARQLATDYTSQFYSPITRLGDKFSDPFVLFDEQADRYFIVNAGYNDCPDCGAHLLAISKTVSPKSLTSQDWHFVRLSRSLERVGGTVVNTNYDGDNDRLAATPDSLLIGSIATYHPRSNIDPENVSSVGARVRVLDKRALMNGQTPPTWLDFIPSTLEDARAKVAPLYDPRDRATGPYRVFFDMRSFDPCGTGKPVSLYLGSIDGLDGAPTLTTRELPVPDVGCRGQPVALQPGAARELLIPHDNTNPVYRRGRLWVFETRSVTVQAGPAVNPVEARCGIHWMELDVSGWPNDVRILQSAIFSEPGVSVLCPAGAFDSAGNFVMVYTRTGSNEFPSICYTGRLPTDPPNTMRAGRLLRAGTRAFDDRPPGYVPDRNQFIDYPAAVLDPADGSIWIGGLVPSPAGPSANGQERSDCWIGRVRPLNVSP